MKCLGVIPARLGSSRLPEKPLKEIHGKSLIQRVWLQASKAKSLSRVIIATDSQQILELAKSFGAEVVMTSPDHISGTDRVSEVSQMLASKGEDFPLVANIQGDMPFINPAVIDKTVDSMVNAGGTFGISTLATPITDDGELKRNSTVKVVFGDKNQALYFSRSPIPCWRDGSAGVIDEQNPLGYKHIGLYVYRKLVLDTISTLTPTNLEKKEALEQLRAIEHGIGIKVVVVSNQEMWPNIEVDTLEDLEKARSVASEFDRLK